MLSADAPPTAVAASIAAVNVAIAESVAWALVISVPQLIFSPSTLENTVEQKASARWSCAHPSYAVTRAMRS